MRLDDGGAEVKLGDYLASASGQLAREVGFAIRAYGFDDPAWHTAFELGWAEAEGARARNILPPGAGARAIALLGHATPTGATVAARGDGSPHVLPSAEAGSTPARPTKRRRRKRRTT